jgi:hypothetical protein
MKNQFELIFQDFVRWFGGNVLSEAYVGKTADYLFTQYGVIAELKTMSKDSTDDINNKVKMMCVKWMVESGTIPTHTIEDSKLVSRISSVEGGIAGPWLDLLRQQIERLVKDANSQIADSKLREGLPSARGILLIANTGNHYHNEPKSLRLLLASILKKRSPSGELRYPHIQGAVFFSAGDVKSASVDAHFWASLQMKSSPDSDVSDIVKFQHDLQQAWYRFITERTGVRIRQIEEAYLGG